jgi:polar amino acid transport system substrate-binding protein
MVALKKVRIIVVVAIVALMALIAAGCSGSETKTSTDTKSTDTKTSTSEAKAAAFETIKAGELQVGSDIAFPPFENMEGSDPVGFDVDLMKEIGERLNLSVVFTNNKFDGLIPSLNSKKFDAVVSAMTITDDRKKEVLFSDPYIDSNQSLASKANSDIKDVANLKGKIVGVQTGTTGQDWTKKHVVSAKEIKSYDTALDAFTALQAGQIDAVINDLPVSAYIVKDKPELKIMQEIKTDESYGIAMKLGDTKLAEAINKTLADMKKDGSYDKVYEKWFGKKK